MTMNMDIQTVRNEIDFTTNIMYSEGYDNMTIEEKHEVHSYRAKLIKQLETLVMKGEK